MATSLRPPHRRQRGEKARDLHVEQVARPGDTRAFPVWAGGNGDDDLLAALSTEGAEARAFLVDECGIDRRTSGKERFCALQDFVAAQARRELLNGSCWCGHVILKGRSRRNV